MLGQHGFCSLGPSAAFLCCVEINPGLAYKAQHTGETTALEKKGLVVHLPSPGCGWHVV